MKKNKNKGFTLAELLIVVAIIGVLVAISIPIFTSQLEKAREATDAANIRSQYAEVMAEAITDGGNVNGQDKFGAVELKQKKNDWQNTGLKKSLEGVYQRIEGYPKAGGIAWVEYKNDQVILHYEDGSGNSGSGSTGGGSSTGGSTGGGSSTGGSTGGSAGGSAGGSTGGGSLGGGPGSSEDRDKINSATNLPYAFDASIHDWDSVVEKDGFYNESHSNYYYNIKPGMVYSYNGAIYFGTKDQQVEYDEHTKHTPEVIVSGDWFALVKYTGVIRDISYFTSWDTPVSAGDLCKVDNDYYVFKDGGYQSSGPVTQPKRWMKIPLN